MPSLKYLCQFYFVIPKSLDRHYFMGSCIFKKPMEKHMNNKKNNCNKITKQEIGQVQLKHYYTIISLSSTYN